jgi:hypothetical protein
VSLALLNYTKVDSCNVTYNDRYLPALNQLNDYANTSAAAANMDNTGCDLSANWTSTEDSGTTVNAFTLSINCPNPGINISTSRKNNDKLIVCVRDFSIY